MNGDPGTFDGWDRTLAECEARLDAAAGPARASTGRPEVAPFADPDVTGPLPETLIDRARAIVERGATLVHDLTTEQERIRAELRRVPRMPRAAGRSSLDIKA